MNETTWEAARQQLIRLLREEAVHYGPVTVGCGTVTDVFVDMSRVTLLSPGLSLIEVLLGPLLANDHVDAVGGPAMGAIPLVTLMARHRGAGFYIRLRESTPGRPAIRGTPPRPGATRIAERRPCRSLPCQTRPCQAVPCQAVPCRTLRR